MRNKSGYHFYLELWLIHLIQIKSQTFLSRETSTPSSYSTCPGLSIKWTGWRLVKDSGTKCAWVIHESEAVQIRVHNNRRCLYVPRVPGSVKNHCTTTTSRATITYSTSDVTAEEWIFRRVYMQHATYITGTIYISEHISSKAYSTNVQTTSILLFHCSEIA